MAEAILHIHLKDDGGILIQRENGEKSCVSPDGLRKDLSRIKTLQGKICYSRDNETCDPSLFVYQMFEEIVSFGIPIQLVPAPDAFQSSTTIDGYIPPLVFAAYHNQLEWLEELLSRGVDINYPDEYGQTPLMMAALQSHLNILEILISHGAKVDARDADGNTALMFAAQTGDTEIVKALLLAGADPKIKGARGFTPYDLAKQNKHSVIISLLR